MRTTGNRFSKGAAILIAAMATVPFLPSMSQARDWNSSFRVPFYRSYRPGRAPYRYYGQRGYYRGNDYYPIYNPVVDRDVYRSGNYRWDGTHQSETLVEDRHASYYSPGRNEAITPPRTSTSQSYGPGYQQTRERTSWIGADRRPHSTTITRTTTQDYWGNTQTDTHVSLKNKREAQTSKPTPQKVEPARNTSTPHKAPQASVKVPKSPAKDSEKSPSKKGR